MDDETIKIQIELKNFMQAMNQIKQLAQAVRQIPGAAGPGGRGGSGGGGGGGGMPKLPKPPPSLQQKIMTGFLRSRVGMGGGLMPLARDLAGIFGPEAVAVSIAARQLGEAAIGAGKALYDMAKEAAEAGVAFGRMQMMSGGTAGQTAFLSSFNTLIGQDLNSLADALARELSAGGYMTGMGPRLGLAPDVGFMSDPNRASNMERLMNAVRSMSDRQYQQMAFISPVIRALGPLRLLSPHQYNYAHSDANIYKGIRTQEFITNSADFVQAEARVAAAFDNLVTATLKPLLPGLIDDLNTLANAINKFAKDVDNAAKTPAGAGAFAGARGASPLGWFDDFIKILKHFGGQDPKTDAHTQAMERHTDALNNAALREGTFGGGERARSAIPSKWGGINTRNYIGEAAKLGAFNL